MLSNLSLFFDQYKKKLVAIVMDCKFFKNLKIYMVIYNVLHVMHNDFVLVVYLSMI